jgi:hypothetical protein
MVSAFWHGYVGGFVKENFYNIADFSKSSLGKGTPMYIAEMAYDIKMASKATVFYETLVFGTVKDEKTIVGAVLATPDGLVKVTANKFIDATGDADLAMLSGAEYMPNGDPRDRVTQGFSVWGDENKGTEFQQSLYKSDEDSISTERYSEFMRGIYAAHLKQSDLGFSALLTVRESRRIKGKYTLNMKDILRGTTFDDTVSVSLCKYDAHGMGSSLSYYTALFEDLHVKTTPDILTRIPLRALLPQKVNGLMVISKAISATRDAGCLIRMNPDIQNTGYAAGLIAANAAKGNLDFEKAYTADLQKSLEEKNVLPDYYNKKADISAKTLVEKIKADDLFAVAVASVCPEHLFAFEQYLNEHKNLALVCLALGSHKVFDNALKEFEKYLLEYKKNKTSTDEIKSYAILLSRIAKGDEAKKQKFVPLLVEAIELMVAGGPHINPNISVYQNSKVSNRIIPNFRVIMALSIAAETLAEKNLAAPLIALSKKENIHPSYGDEIHSVQLYLRIIAAAARCGDATSVDELKKALSSERLFFREFAKSELEALKLAQNGVLPLETGELWD